MRLIHYTVVKYLEFHHKEIDMHSSSAVLEIVICIHMCMWMVGVCTYGNVVSRNYKVPSLYACVLTCMCVFVYLCKCIRLSVHVYVNVCTSGELCVCMRIYVCVWVCAFAWGVLSKENWLNLEALADCRFKENLNNDICI